MQYLMDQQESERLFFRKLEESDFTEWVEFFKDPASIYQRRAGITDPVENCRFWFEKVFYRYTNNKGGMNALIDKETQTLVGQCGLLIQMVDDLEELEIGYSIMPLQRNKGYASEAAIACKEYAFANNFRDSLVSIIAPDNVKSQSVALKNGMQLEKMTTFFDKPAHIFRVWK